MGAKIKSRGPLIQQQTNVRVKMFSLVPSFMMTSRKISLRTIFKLPISASEGYVDIRNDFNYNTLGLVTFLFLGDEIYYVWGNSLSH